MDPFTVIGERLPRADGNAKVRGRAKYAGDYHFPNGWAGVMVRIPSAHADVHSIDASAIADHAVFKGIIRSSDIPGMKKVGPIRRDQPIFADERVLTGGDVVAMLIGTDKKILVQLSENIKIEYTPLPVLEDPREALRPNALLIHPEYDSNLIAHHVLRKGDLENGFSASDCIIERSYTTQRVEHAYLEPEVVTAIPSPDGSQIKILGSIQNPFTTRNIVASVLNLGLSRIRVVPAELGGSFGGKDDLMNILSSRAALAALRTGRPVTIHYDREESILESHKRHPYAMCYKVGFMNDGKIRAMEIDIVADGGAYASKSEFVTWRTLVHATGPYEIENVSTDVRVSYTNNAVTGSMRGFGSPQPIFAQESLMDEIAEHLSMAPDDIRRMNGFRSRSITATGHELKHHDVNLVPVLDLAVKHSGFNEKWRSWPGEDVFGNKKNTPCRRSPENPRDLLIDPEEFIEPQGLWKKGIGLALSYRGCSLGAEGVDAVAAYLSLQPDGSAYLLCGLAENGQGLRTTLSMILGEILGIPLDQITYLDTDTALIPDSGPTVASRATLMGGGAVKDAGETLRRRLEKVLREEWDILSDSTFLFKKGQVFVVGNPSRIIEFSELCRLAYRRQVSLAAIGWYRGDEVTWDEKTGQGRAYFTYVYNCQVAEVSVNRGTGEVYVDRIVAVHDPGRVINPLGAEGQVYGGVTQGAGYALWEEISSNGGYIQELNFDRYMIPTSLDLGEIVLKFIEGRDSHGPWGAKSLGEPALECTAAAIANAVNHALGERFYNLPLNLEEVFLKNKLQPKSARRGSER